ncbi:glyoxalase/bleomycin resistance protein/dioxygenase [Cellulomonas flavigena DSM 20109]|uniref:Glyoxalase/bleomycin resistance protein/dioxygenase n=1 Tax=Cellulomonas flavigena (strain ATCC 482 / DSM 20109 / BCRC 11376 / JCM 18109 / NBRC 3775 / NCIMB 8073 / NRS 134) TaxID=446466 RepID=D5UGC5_CELFN|nr:VOC family protein [Cellulomonas flavigena]ADG73108.1 glyoxalase/bleomycin resistance protein/dioxygenase [Cellulomonas flavigena DSM 20109]
MADRPRLSVTSVTVGSPDPRASARFWAQLLGHRITADDPPGPDEPAEGGWARVSPPAGVDGLTLAFEHERQWRPPVWPARPGEQLATQHVDVHVRDGDLDAAVAWAVACGARLAEHQPQDDVRVLFAPDGHPFCLFL